MKDPEAKSSLDNKKTDRSTKAIRKGGESREDHIKSLSWMFGIEIYVTCGDLTLLLALKSKYN